MYVATVNEKRGCELEREQKVVHGRIWREEMEGEWCNHIITSKKSKYKQQKNPKLMC